MVPNSSSAARGLSPAVGSSSRSRSGAFISAIAIGQDLALAAAQGARRGAPLLGQHGEALVELGHALPGMRTPSMKPPISRFSATLIVPNTLRSCGTKDRPRRLIAGAPRPAISLLA